MDKEENKRDVLSGALKPDDYDDLDALVYGSNPNVSKLTPEEIAAAKEREAARDNREVERNAAEQKKQEDERRKREQENAAKPNPLDEIERKLGIPHRK